MFKQLLAAQLKQLLAAHEQFFLLDVRHSYEHEVNHIPNSILIPLPELSERIAELEQYKDTPIIVYCQAGVRSAMACKFLAAHGFKQLVNLTDGMQAW